MKHTKTEIVLRLYERLKQSPCTIDILKSWRTKNGYDFSDRTLYRYLDELVKYAAAQNETLETIEHGENNKKTWKLVFNKSIEYINTEDINSFYLFKNFIPKSIISERKNSFQKIENLIYANFSKSGFEKNIDAHTLNTITSDFYDSNYSKANHKLLEDIIWAIQNKRQITIDKLLEIRITTIKTLNIADILYPLQLQFHRGELFVCVYNKTNETIQIIALTDLMNISFSNATFNPKKHIDLLNKFRLSHFGITENVDSVIYDIELEFTNKTGVFVQTMFWHKTQQFEILPSGNLLMRLNCGINRELVGWIFQWMSNVKVLSPAILQQTVLDKYKECATIYNTDKEFNYNNSFYPK